MATLKQLVLEGWSLVEGMRVTLKRAMRPTVTVEYPRVQASMSPAQRNAIRLIVIEEKGTHDCIACLQCQKICPSKCITIEGARPDGLVFKRPTKFDMNFALCSECGLCIDVCPTETLGWSKTYDKAGYSRDFLYDLLEPYRADEEKAIAGLKEFEAKKKAAKAAADAKAKAEAEAKAKAEAEAKAKESAAGSPVSPMAAPATTDPPPGAPQPEAPKG